MIRPTVGRILFVFSTLWAGPRPGSITKVWSDTCVNVVVQLDHDDNTLRANHGNVMPLTSVLLYDAEKGPKYQPTEGDAVASLFHAEWMPYQVGQAPASSAVQDQLKGLQEAANRDSNDIVKLKDAVEHQTAAIAAVSDAQARSDTRLRELIDGVGQAVSNLSERVSRVEQSGSTGTLRPVDPPPAKPETVGEGAATGEG